MVDCASGCDYAIVLRDARHRCLLMTLALVVNIIVTAHVALHLWRAFELALRLFVQGVTLLHLSAAHLSTAAILHQQSLGHSRLERRHHLLRLVELGRRDLSDLLRLRVIYDCHKVRLCS